MAVRQFIGWVARLLLLAMCLRGAVAVAHAQDPPPDSQAVAALRAELRLERSVYSPSEPVLLRLTLFNPSDQPIELSGTSAAGPADPVALPAGLLFGTREQPALTIAYEQESPVPVLPPEGLNTAATARLTLAPRTALGTAIDLRALHRPLRYAGEHRIQWRPFGDAGPSASASLRIEPRKLAILVTDYGKITFQLAYDTAPRNVENFLSLVRQRFYDGLVFHRIIPQFIIQGGSPDGTSTGVRADGVLVPAEFNDTPFVAGTLAMARKPSDPHSASCQFFISLARNPELDGQYTVIGQASDEESLRTLRQLAELPTDADGRPLRPVVIRFLTLVDAEPPAPERLQTARP